MYKILCTKISFDFGTTRIKKLLFYDFQFNLHTILGMKNLPSGVVRFAKMHKKNSKGFEQKLASFGL